MAKFKNVGGAAVHVYRPAGSADSLLVESEQVLEAPGEVTEETDDCYVVGEGDNARAWPKVQWELVVKAGKPAGKAMDES